MNIKSTVVMILAVLCLSTWSIAVRAEVNNQEHIETPSSITKEAPQKAPEDNKKKNCTIKSVTLADGSVVKQSLNCCPGCDKGCKSCC